MSDPTAAAVSVPTLATQKLSVGDKLTNVIVPIAYPQATEPLEMRGYHDISDRATRQGALGALLYPEPNCPLKGHRVDLLACRPGEAYYQLVLTMVDPSTIVAGKMMSNLMEAAGGSFACVRPDTGEVVIAGGPGPDQSVNITFTRNEDGSFECHEERTKPGAPLAFPEGVRPNKSLN